MGALVAAFALTYCLIRAAASGQERRATRLRRRLDRLGASLAAGRLSLDGAEDGAVLARRFGEGGLEKKFREAAASLKRSRTCR